MPYPSLTQRDTTADKIPSKCCGLGAFTGGAGFGLFVSVPIALIGKASRATKRRFERKRYQKNVQREIDALDGKAKSAQSSSPNSGDPEKFERQKELLGQHAQRQQEIAAMPTASEFVAKRSASPSQKGKAARKMGDLGAFGV